MVQKTNSNVEIVKLEQNFGENEISKPYCPSIPTYTKVSLGEKRLETCDEHKCVTHKLINDDHQVTSSCKESRHFHISQMDNVGDAINDTPHKEDHNGSSELGSNVVNVYHDALKREPKSCIKPTLEHHHHKHDNRAMLDGLDIPHEPLSNQILSHSGSELPDLVQKDLILEASIIEDGEQSQHFQSDLIVEVIGKLFVTI